MMTWPTLVLLDQTGWWQREGQCYFELGRPLLSLSPP
jgi:hypothetical protein